MVGGRGRPPCAVKDIPDVYGPELAAYNKRALQVNATVKAVCPSCSKAFKVWKPLGTVSLTKHRSHFPCLLHSPSLDPCFNLRPCFNPL